MYLPIVYFIAFFITVFSVWTIAFHCEVQFTRWSKTKLFTYPLVNKVLTALFKLWSTLFIYTTPLWTYCALTFWIQPELSITNDLFYIPLAFWYVFYGLAIELPEEPSEAFTTYRTVYPTRH